ncbi:MAG: 3-deoxy-manno-octulosonate cytidylyltransferase [Deltaproteobacteria bacterium]|nr:3-deoxy-manno-octulosonate cytidylyltransferase [Deltaproteobacteria bacterium]
MQVVEAVGIIPARYDAKRLPGKPLALIQDRPMIQHVYERAAGAASLQRLVVATDDSRIQQEVARFGGEVLMTSGDHKSGTDRVAEAARRLMLSDSTIVVNIQGDEPLLQTEMIDSLVDTLKAQGDVDMATLAHPGTDSDDFHDPAVVKVVLDSKGRALYFSRAPIPTLTEPSSAPQYYKHLGFYGFRNGFLQEFTKLSPGILERQEKLEQLRALEHGFHISVVITSHDSVSVDTPEDLALVRNILKHQG